VKYGDAFEQHPKLIQARPVLADGLTTWPEIIEQFTSDDFQKLEQSARFPSA
jgi:hypothetical protein